ncbi:DUF1800 domain-containing protein [Tahibacter amnicola]|uniref:DUF1800 domain-containing protein n=1 Tax=Tahibacter amnicola TaxID=2976241 RepID=A0ABY6BPR5_9GAMM|nr:DUF1800 domain-containing protein [Tahibacter amnicola]UXI69762.1 DUF1800 domain-containing protein [Tahibacter amnicola]
MVGSTATASAFATRRRLFGALACAIGIAEPETAPMRRSEKPSMDTRLAERDAAAVTYAVPPAPFRWLSKAGFGVSPADIAALAALPGASDEARWAAWVERQLAPASINDSACDSRLAAAALTTLGKSLQQLWTDHESTADYAVRMRPMAENECATLIRQAYSQRQLFETMVDFWHDHFSVFGWDYNGGPVFPHYDRDIIRPRALGNFRAMLEEVTKSTTMMYYLDLYSSTRAGPNENFARELFELHTLGAENYGGVLYPDDPSLPIGQLADGTSVRLKYVDIDVYEATSALTGWTLRNGHWQYPAENDGTFIYRDDWHDQYQKYILNRYIAPYQHQADGTRLLDILASHPGTARFVAKKLCRRFVADDPPAALVNAAATEFITNWQAPDQIARVVRLILNSADFRTSWGLRMKRPAVAAVGALRALGADFTPVPDYTSAWTTSEEFISRLQFTGNRLFYWPAPNGYPDKRVAWASTGALGMTFRLLGRLPEMRQVNGNTSTPYVADVLAQTLAAFPNAADRHASNIAGYWCDRLLGGRPSPTYPVAVNYLRQNAAATEALSLNEAWAGTNLKAHYTQSRLRTMVALILCSPDYLRR